MGFKDLWQDGPATIEAAIGFSPDPVLLNTGLPGMDGYQIVPLRLTRFCWDSWPFHRG